MLQFQQFFCITYIRFIQESLYLNLTIIYTKNKTKQNSSPISSIPPRPTSGNYQSVVWICEHGFFVFVFRFHM